MRDVDEDCLYLNIFSPNVSLLILKIICKESINKSINLQIDSGLAQPYSVMLYIHGGEFTHGASNLFPAHILAAFYDVVVVSINYRLGALGKFFLKKIIYENLLIITYSYIVFLATVGFLSTGDENSPGNYGILDQAMALRWVYDNIGDFNGNPDAITLFGPGAGAASAGLLMIAPR